MEHTLWQENWSIEGERLVLSEASVAGSGAGIAPPPDAVLREGRWHYHPGLPPLKSLNLAASGATASPWSLCVAEGRCLTLGETAGEPITIWSGPACEAPP